MVDEYNDDPDSPDLQGYSGLFWPSPRAYLPRVYSNADSDPWYTGIIIQNASASSNQLQIRVNGALVSSPSLNPNGWHYTPLNANGSAVIESTNGQPFVVPADTYHPTARGDTLLSYLTDNR